MNLDVYVVASTPPAAVEQKTADTPQTAYMCQVCNYVTVTKSDIENHIRERHKKSDLDTNVKARNGGESQ